MINSPVGGSGKINSSQITGWPTCVKPKQKRASVCASVCYTNTTLQGSDNQSAQCCSKEMALINFQWLISWCSLVPAGCCWRWVNNPRPEPRSRVPRLIIIVQADTGDRYSQCVEAPQSSERTWLQVLDFVKPQIPVEQNEEKEKVKKKVHLYMCSHQGLHEVIPLDEQMHYSFWKNVKKKSPKQNIFFGDSVCKVDASTEQVDRTSSHIS